MKTCENCNKEMPNKRKDTITCGVACRQARSRRLRALPIPEPLNDKVSNFGLKSHFYTR